MMRWTVISGALILVSYGCAIAFAEGGIPPASVGRAPPAQTQAGSAPSPVQQALTEPPNPAASLPTGIAPITPDSPLMAGTESVPSPPQPQQQRVLLQASWDYGLRFESDDKQFSFHVGGIGQIDTAFLIGPQSVFALPGGGSNGVGNAEATLLRRGILQADGTIYEQFDYVIAFDFANASNDNSGLQPPSFGNLSSSPAPLNIWMQVRDVPYLGYVRVGNMDKPIGMTNNTSAAFLPFMERPDNQDAFYGPFDNGFALGIMALNWTESERMTWRYGVFQPATDVFGVALNKYTVGARVTGLPWYEDEGRSLIHLGFGYWGGEIVQDQLRVRARPLLRNAPGFAVPVLVDTGELPGHQQFTIAPEFAMVLGPLTIQAEWAGQFFTNALDSSGMGQGTVFYHGGYIEALYFLTGEHREYARREGVFGRVVPLRNYHWKKGDCYKACGAWEIGVRFSYLDLDSKSVQAGNLYDWTLGLNWYLNPNMKCQLNWIAEHRDMPGVTPGWINGVGARVAYDF